MPNESKAIVPVTLESYTLARMSTEQIKEVLTANFGGQTLDPVRDLDRVKIPAGGATTWEIPTLTGIDANKELSGIVIHFQRANARWEGDEITGTPPICSSNDGITGVGDPGGACVGCPQAGFEGNCKPTMRLFLLRENALVPMLVSLPRMSIRGFITYLAKLTQPFFTTAMVFTLEKAQSKRTGAPYAKVIPHFSAPLDATAIPIINAYRDAMVPVLRDMPVSSDEFAGNEGNEGG